MFTKERTVCSVTIGLVLNLQQEAEHQKYSAAAAATAAAMAAAAAATAPPPPAPQGCRLEKLLSRYLSSGPEAPGK